MRGQGHKLKALQGLSSYFKTLCTKLNKPVGEFWPAYHLFETSGREVLSEREQGNKEPLLLD